MDFLSCFPQKDTPEENAATIPITILIYFFSSFFPPWFTFREKVTPSLWR